MGEMWLNKGKNMNLLQNTDKQIEEYKKFNELNSIQKLKKLKDIKTLGDRKKKGKKKNKKPRERQTVRSYKSYINSKLWTRRKNEFFKKYGKQCSCCNSTKFVQLHHKVYTGIYGNEPDRHLIAMCSNCHNLFHDTYGVKADMQEDTKQFVGEMKSSIHLKKEMEMLENWVKTIGL
jgi:hypothetical protein